MTSPPADRRSPTVVVARTVAPGRERDFERWVERLVATASEAPGYLGAEVQPPDDLHPEEWVIVYQFDDADRLAAWLESPERAALMADGADLVAGPAREQVVALAPERAPVTAVSSVRVRPGSESAYRDLHAEVVRRLQTFEGFLNSDLYEPIPGVQDDTVVVFAFDTREHLDRWLRSEERREVLARMDELSEGGRTVNVVGGFAGWFAPEGAPAVKRWKQAVVVLAALYPTVLVLNTLRDALLPDLPFAAGLLLVNVTTVSLLTWVLMPALTRRLDGWLRR